MIYPLLRLRCNYCTNSVADEFDSEEDARKIMGEQGWTHERVQNGSIWDKCPRPHPNLEDTDD